MTTPDRILVLGASGYVGGRLVPELLQRGHAVRCMTRSRQRLVESEWAETLFDIAPDRFSVVEGDLDVPESLGDAFADIDQVVYLVHSLGEEDFERREAETAEHARRAAERGGVRRFVYLSGLGDESDDLSAHLRSRHEVGRVLAEGTVDVIELRAAVVLGAGSASFEMMRSLVEVLPVMLAPRWVTTTQLQPVGIADVLSLLTAALDQPLDDRGASVHRVVEIGGADVVTYRELMEAYARVVGLRRLVVPVPVLSLGLSTHWVNLVTPLPKRLAASLIGSLKNDVIVRCDDDQLLPGREMLGVERSIEVAVSAIQDLDIPTRWSGVSPGERSARPKPWDAEWAGGTVYEDCRERQLNATTADLHRVVRGIGGERGWFGFGPLWAVRGVFDKLLGGVGLRRGRRHPDNVMVGEAIDFWRVEAMDDDLFRLRAEMLLPGEAWLEWTTSCEEGDDDNCTVVQRARYVPKGLLGRLYWWVLIPFHAVIFPIMLRRIAAAAEASRDRTATR